MYVNKKQVCNGLRLWECIQCVCDKFQEIGFIENNSKFKLWCVLCVSVVLGMICED